MTLFGVFLRGLRGSAVPIVFAIVIPACGLKVTSFESRKGPLVVESTARPEFEPQDWFIPSAFTDSPMRLPPYRVNWARVRGLSTQAGVGAPIPIQPGDRLFLRVLPKGESSDCPSSSASIQSSWRRAMAAPRDSLSTDYYLHSSVSERTLAGTSPFTEDMPYLLSAAVVRNHSILVCIPKVAEFRFDSRQVSVLNATLPVDAEPGWVQDANRALGLRHRSEFLGVQGTCAVKKGGTLIDASRGDRMFVTFLGIEQGELLLENAERVTSGPELGAYTGVVYIDTTHFPQSTGTRSQLVFHCEASNGVVAVENLATGADFEPPSDEMVLIDLKGETQAQCTQSVRIPCAMGDQILGLVLSPQSEISVSVVDGQCDVLNGGFRLQVQALNSPTVSGLVSLTVSDPAAQTVTRQVEINFDTTELMNRGGSCRG